MRKSFYHYLMKFRQPTAKDDITQFANSAYDDHSFPKQSEQYHEISSYLEMNGHYLESMSIFDSAWDHYQLEEKD
ncbi:MULTISPECIES: YozE family protein [Bacillaceae]|uniref:YozE family protein n=1 Tax=Bacillaceae TaxID=186817 RepID=UPI001A8EE551|nr:MULTISPECIES: YozE family protein [Rossellomorea]MBN8190634.1 YozE family protein [Bacillus sp. NTK074B]MBW3113201.1 YozE family protein [Bacillus sp. MCCB 382]MDX8343802.1 YozE family protein [Rossellomorea sp. YZS02]